MPIPFSKQWKDERKYEAILEKAIITFGAQYKLLKMQGASIETKNGANLCALGYLGEFLHCAMRAQQLDISSEQAARVFRKLFENMWGPETCLRCAKAMLDAKKNNNEEFRDGELRGVIDYEYAAKKGNQPMGWFSCFKD